MRTQQKSQWLFRIFAALVVFAMLFAQSANVANAQGTKPPVATKEKVQIAQVNLDEVQNYYGRLGDITGPVRIVVELADKPAALVYAESKGQARVAELTQKQVSLIAQKQSNFMSALKTMGIQSTEMYRTQKVYNGIWMSVDAKHLNKIAALPGVLAIHPVIAKTVEHTTSVPLIGAPQVWGGLAGLLGENITVGIIDTGIDYVHTNFGGPGVYTGQDFTTLGEVGNLFPTAKVVGGWDFAGDAYNANDATPVIAPDPDPMDCNDHGSHVAGSAAGLGVLPDGSTYVEAGADTYDALEALSPSAYVAKFRIGPGVAPKANLYGLRVFGCAGSTDLTEQAIEWAMDPNNDGDFADHLDVINMSLGSNFGSEYDSSAAASNNAAQAGVIVVTSAGNSGDVYFITGAPGMARYAISTANTVDSGAVVSAFEATAPAALAGSHAGVEAGFGPDPGTPGTTGNIATTTPANGCTAITEDLTGKIALIDRGTCTFKTKVRNAQLKGAIGVLVANNTVGFPIVMGDDALIIDPITIPSMMTTLAVGNAIKAQLAVPEVVTIRLTSEFRNQFQMTDLAVEDTVVSSSSRGLARGASLLKPDISAPGDSIFSTANGTGNQGVSFGGTSMASPHMAGVMALLLQEHPTWSVAELKALAMNTATNNLYTGLNHTGLLYTPTRVGAGRASVANAVQSEVVAYYANDPGQVSVAFGQVEVVGGIQNFTKSITISNKGVDSQSYNVAFDSRYQANPGLTFTLLDAGGAALANPVTVPGNSTLEVQVQVTIDPLLLSRARDATIATTGSRQRFSEAGGYVTLTSTTTEPSMRVPVHIAARPAANMSVTETNITLPAAATGTFDLTLSGTPVDTLDDTSLAYVFELMGEDPDEASSNGSTDASDIQYVGVSTDYPYWAFADGALFFGLSTYGRWDTSQAVEFDIFIDFDEDGLYDYVVFNGNQGFFTGTTDDVMLTTYCSVAGGSGVPGCDAWYYTNLRSGTTNTNMYHNNVITLPVPFFAVGLEDGINTDFNFQVVSFNRDGTGVIDETPVYSYDVAAQSFDLVDGFYNEEPVWYDVPAAQPTFTFGYNKANIAANNSKGLLFLRTHNSVNSAEVLRLPPSVVSIDRVGENPNNDASVDFTVTFTNPVTGVDSGDFFIDATGLSGAAITSVSGSGDTYTVSVNTGSGDGTLAINVADNDSIKDADANRLGGIGSGNGDFSDGQVYNIVKSITFSDVEGEYWAWSYIERLFDAGITGGCSTIPLSFCPERATTRAEMAIYILRGMNGSSFVPPAATGLDFGDVNIGDFAADWIEELYAEGVTGGCGGGNYCPDQTITRAQMAIFLLRGKYGSAYVPPTATGTVFGDVAADSFGAAFIEQLAVEGITAGCGGGNFCPDAPVTRGEMAVFIVRTFNLP